VPAVVSGGRAVTQLDPLPDRDLTGRWIDEGTAMQPLREEIPLHPDARAHQPTGAQPDTRAQTETRGTRVRPGKPSLLHELNDRAALDLLLGGEMLTRSQISEYTGLSKVTVSQMLTRLEERGLVAIAAEQAGASGTSRSSSRTT